MNEVNKDFTKLLNNIEKDEKSVMDEIGRLLVSEQKNILRRKVKNWSGRLSDSIRRTYYKNKVVVGSDIDYAEFIEEGNGAFLGYWYMRDSLINSKGRIIEIINKMFKV